MHGVAVTFLDEQAEVQNGELVNPFRIVDGTIRVEKASGGPFTIITSGEDGESFVLQEVPRQRISAFRVF